MIEVHVDLNVRCGHNGQLTFAGYRDVKSPYIPAVGTSVIAVVAEENLEAPAIVVAVNKGAALVYLAVAWLEFHERVPVENVPLR